MKRLTNIAAVGFGWALFFSAGSLHACGVCMGQSDGSQMGGAINGAIFVMLGFLALMLTGIGAVAFSIVRRAKNPLPSHLDLADVIGAQSLSK